MDQVRRTEKAIHIMALSIIRIETKMVKAALVLVMGKDTAVTARKMEQVTDLETALEPANVMVLVLKETVAEEAAENKY
jgi:hypothetical protein